MIDVHAHVIVRELLREAAPRRSGGPVRAAGREFGGRIRSAVGEFVDVPRILEQIAADRVVLSPWVPLLFEDVERAGSRTAALASWLPTA